MPETALSVTTVGKAGTAKAVVDADISNGNSFPNNGRTYLYLFNDGGANQKQTVSITGSPDGGTFTLTYDGQTTSGIAYNADAATVQAALVALSNIASGDVAVTGSNPNFTATFGGNFSGTQVEALTADGGNLTGGTDPDVDIATVTGSATVTINTNATFRGYAIANQDITIADGEEWFAGPFDPSIFNDSSGNATLSLTGTGAANVDLLAFK